MREEPPHPHPNLPWLIDYQCPVSHRKRAAARQARSQAQKHKDEPYRAVKMQSLEKWMTDAVGGTEAQEPAGRGVVVE
jgi:hypothetical protein